MNLLGAALTFLLQHLDLITLIGEAVTRGVSKETLSDAIRKTMVAASDEQMKAELGEDT
jgi:hypothetical protein